MEISASSYHHKDKESLSEYSPKAHPRVLVGQSYGQDDVPQDEYTCSSFRRCFRCDGYPMLILFGMPLVVAFSMLVSFGLAIAFISAGGWILGYTASLHVAYSDGIITRAFAQVLICGCGIVDGTLFVVALTVAWVTNRAGRSGTVVFWVMEGVGTLVGAAFVPVVGVVVLPTRMGPNGFTIVEALKAGLLGSVFLQVPLFSWALYMLFFRKKQVSI